MNDADGCVESARVFIVSMTGSTMMVVLVIWRQPRLPGSRSKTMPEPASSSESTKQSGGISVKESRHSQSSSALTSMTVQFPHRQFSRAKNIYTVN